MTKPEILLQITKEGKIGYLDILPSQKQELEAVGYSFQYNPGVDFPVHGDEDHNQLMKMAYYEVTKCLEQR